MQFFLATFVLFMLLFTLSNGFLLETTPHANSGSTRTVKSDNIVTFGSPWDNTDVYSPNNSEVTDIRFKFKTKATDGLFLHSVPVNSPDFIKVALRNCSTIEFRFNTTNGETDVNFVAPIALNDDQWHTVFLTKNRQKTAVRVDNFPERHTINPGFNNITGISGIHIGGNIEDELGFVGCMGQLKINGLLVDLESRSHRMIQKGCVEYCKTDRYPCLHGGECHVHDGDPGFKCDCSLTPFGGRNCGKEIGVNMKKHFMIKYYIARNTSFANAEFVPYLTFLGLEFLQIGFRTQFRQGTLMQLQGHYGGENITLGMNDAGGLTFLMRFGNGEFFGMNTRNNGKDFADNQQHVVRMWRTGAHREIFNLQVDNFPIDTANFGTLRNLVLVIPSQIYIGNIGKNTSEMFVPLGGTKLNQMGFEGCIYSMQINDVMLLKEAFKNPKPDNIVFTPEDGIKESTCGNTEMTVAPENTCSPGIEAQTTHQSATASSFT